MVYQIVYPENITWGWGGQKNNLITIVPAQTHKSWI